MAPRRLGPHEVASALPRGGRTLVAGCSGESLLFAEAVMRAGDALGAMTFTGIFVPGLNTRTYLANPDCRVETFFLTPELKAAGDAVAFLPLGYGDILARLRAVPIDAALFMATPPDADGLCGFGPVVDFLADLWPKIPVRIAHINPLMPNARGSTGIPFRELTAYVEGEQSLLNFPDAGSDPVTEAIGDAMSLSGSATVRRLRLASARCRPPPCGALKGRRNLKIHSGLIGEARRRSRRGRSARDRARVTGGVAIGSNRLYDAVGGPHYWFDPVSYTHSPRVVIEIENFVALNSAVEVDLFGQGYAEMGPQGLMSGPGGASDFAARPGARADYGSSPCPLPRPGARSAASSRRTPSAGPILLGRMDTDVVVTEYGVSRSARPRSITIAPGVDRYRVAEPSRRSLEDAWAKFAAKF